MRCTLVTQRIGLRMNHNKPLHTEILLASLLKFR
jgi:hypothetical protein